MSARDGGKLEQRPQTNYLIFQSERKKCERLKVKLNYVLLFFFIIEDSLFDAFTLLHYAESKFVSEDEAKLLGSSLCVCQNLNVNVCVSFRT